MHPKSVPHRQSVLKRDNADIPSGVPRSRGSLANRRQRCVAANGETILNEAGMSIPFENLVGV